MQMKGPESDRNVLSEEKFQENREFIRHPSYWKAVQLDGWTTHIFEKGAGETIFFVPICQNIEVFDAELLKYFSERYRVITYQRRERENEKLSISDRVNDALSVLDYLDIHQAHFVSHSSGSIVGTTLAMEKPELFSSYVWMNLSRRAARDLPWHRKLLTSLIYYIPFPDALVLHYLAKSCSGNAGKGDDYYDRVYEQFAKVRETASIDSLSKWFVNSVWSLADYSFGENLRQLTFPVLLLNSDNDLVNSVDAMGEFRAYLPDCRGYKIIEGGHHFFQYPEYAQVIDAINNFYSEIGV
jgi:pimeloyl-ACP methyl ester carboxylesterase